MFEIIKTQIVLVKNEFKSNAKLSLHLIDSTRNVDWRYELELNQQYCLHRQSDLD